MVFELGKKITVYLTDKEFEALEKIESLDTIDNQSRAVKKAVMEMFNNVFVLPPCDKCGRPNPSLLTFKEARRMIFKKEGVEGIRKALLKKEA